MTKKSLINNEKYQPHSDDSGEVRGSKSEETPGAMKVGTKKSFNKSEPTQHCLP